MRHDPDAATVILSPHLDDAVLSAWSALTGAAAVQVVNVFAGMPEAGTVTRWDRLAGGTDSRALMTERLAEDRDALALVGAAPICLPFRDRQYRDGAPEVAELEDAIGACVTTAASLHAPAGIGRHVDHELVRDAAVALARVTRIPLTLYAELPYAVNYGWPEWVTGGADGRGPADADWELCLADAPLDRQALAPRAHRLSEEQASAKLSAMRRYRTQFPLLNRGPIGMLEHPHVLPFEVTFAVDPAADALAPAPRA